MNKEMNKETIDKKQMVLETTLELIMEHGVQATSMAKVSKASGVAVGTIYHHFASKEAIITELYRYYKLLMIEALTPELTAVEDLQQAFRLAAIRILAFAENNATAFQFIETYYASPVISQEVRDEMEQRFSTVISAYFDDLRNQGVVSENRTNEMLNLYLSGSLFTMIRAQISGIVKWDKMTIDSYIQMIWYGLTKD